MGTMNNLLIEGYAVKDAAIHTSNTSNHQFAVFSIANNHYYKDDKGIKHQDTLFLDVIAAGRLMKPCEEYVKKGTSIRVVGRLKEYSWVNESGQKRSKFEVIAVHIDFLSKEDKNGGDDGFSIALTPDEVFEVEKYYG